MDGLLLSDIGASPSISDEGMWMTRNPTFARSFRTLFVKQLRWRLRSSHVVFEFVLSVFLMFLVFVLDYLSLIAEPETRDPPVVWDELLGRDLAIFMLARNDSKLVGGPNIPRVQAMLHELSYTLHLIKKDSPVQPEYGETLEEVTETVDRGGANGIGIFWKNADADDAFESPDIEIYFTCLLTCPHTSTFRALRGHLARQAKKLYEGEKNLVGRLGLLNVSTQHFPYPKHFQAQNIIIVFALLLPLPCLLVTMSDFEAFLEEKENKVLALMHMSGCGEGVYLIVISVISFIFAFIPYLIMAILFHGFGRLADVDFGIVFSASILYIIGHIFFMHCAATFLSGLKEARAFFVVYQLVIVVLTYTVHEFAVKMSFMAWISHCISIVPAGAYIVALYHTVVNTYIANFPITWGDLANGRHFWVRDALLCLLGDCFLYFVLFIVLKVVRVWRGSLSGTRNSSWRGFLSKKQFSPINPHEDLVTVHNLNLTYPGAAFPALHDVSLSIKPGELVMMIGENGAGKTTFVNTLVGILSPSSGTLAINGRPPSPDFSQLENYVGVVFQENVFIGKLTTRENLQLFGALKGLSDADLRASMEYFVETLKLTHTLDTYADKLSGGEKRKLCIAMALIGGPPIVIMDEPTAGVDVQSRQLIWKTIALFRKTSWLVTSHALEESESISDRILIMSHASLKFSGTPNELRRLYHCGYVVKVDNTSALPSILDIAMRFDPDAVVCDDALRLPVSPRVPEFITTLEARLSDLDIKSYSVSVDHLEDTLVSLLNSL